MKSGFMKKIGSAVMAIAMIAGTFTAAPVYAASGFDVIFEDLTATATDTLPGEAKIMVSIRGASSGANTIQMGMEFDGDLEFKDVDFLVDVPELPDGFALGEKMEDENSINVALINNKEKIDLSDGLFVITFEGEVGKSVTLTLDNDKEVTWIKSGGTETHANKAVSKTVTSTDSENEAMDISVKLEMNKVSDYDIRNKVSKENPITLTVTNERTGSRFSVVIDEEHEKSPLPPTFVVADKVLKGDTYTVELSSNGYTTYIKENVDFSKELKITNDEFRPGDIDKDGDVDADDKEIYDFIINPPAEDDENADSIIEYSAAADFNRDGEVDEHDNVFDGIEDKDDKEETEKTVPGKPDKPTLDGGKKKIAVEWKKPSDGGSAITGYVIKYGTEKDDLDEEVKIEKGSTTKYTITDLDEDTKYYVAIAAVNAKGQGDFSEVASATTDDSGSTGGGGGGGGGLGGGGSTTTPTPGTTVKPTPSNPNEPFTDLGGYDWAKDSIYSLKNKGIISGTSETTYSPANNIKRGDFILILTRMLGINDEFTENFADVPANMYYYNAIGSAKAAGIATGDGQNFMPENTITRQDLITLAYRAFLAKGYIAETDDMSSLDAFADRGSISDYAKTAMASMVKAEIIKGSDGNVNPLGNATRAEVAVMCARLAALMD